MLVKTHPCAFKEVAVNGGKFVDFLVVFCSVSKPISFVMVREQGSNSGKCFCVNKMHFLLAFGPS